MVIALGIKVSVCAVRVKQNFREILQDEDDDLIDLYPALQGNSDDVIQTSLAASASPEVDGDVWRKYGTAQAPRDRSEYTPLENAGSDHPEDSKKDSDVFDEDSEQTGALIEEESDLDRDGIPLGASALHPEGDSSVQVVKRRINRMDAISEDLEEGSQSKTQDVAQMSDDDDNDDVDTKSK